MSDRDEFYRRFSKSYDKLYQSEKRDDLVERVAHVFWDTPGKPDDRLRAAIAVALEEAAKVCDVIETKLSDQWRANYKVCDYTQGASDGANDCAAAIRALIPKESA